MLKEIFLASGTFTAWCLKDLRC